MQIGRFFTSSIRRRLWFAFGMIIAATVAQGLLAGWSAARLGAAVKDVAGLRLPASVSLGKIAALSAAYRSQQFQLTLASEADRPPIERALAAMRAAIGDESGRFAALPQAASVKTAFADALGEWDAYLAHDERIRQLIADGLPLQATEILDGDAKRTYESTRAALDALIARNGDEAAQVTRRSASLQDQADYVAAAAVLASLLVVGVVAWPVVRRLQSKLVEATETAQELATGRLLPRERVSGHDELAVLSRALETMASRWRDLVIDIRGSAEQVFTASHEIAQGSGELSRRTEAQAAYVQQVGELSATLQRTASSNSDDAMRADALSKQASQGAREAADMLDALRRSIEGLAVGANRIAEISAVIDGLATQTKILALNAAAEAVRAGSQSGGFTVVATEVRRLATRSADAARDIKEIVDTNVREIRAGSKLADSVAMAVTALAHTNDRSSEGVSKIAAASRGQTQAIGDMNLRIADIDGGTQRNAALVEELAAAAESMRTQAVRLVDLMKTFEVGEDRR